MPKIHLETSIAAPAELCFDVSRSVDVHMESIPGARERAVAGVMSGLMALNDTVTWEAIHFGIRQRLTSKITVFDPPRMFVDEMLCGAFKRWHHTHLFQPGRGGTLMIDVVDFASPLGLLGEMFDAVFLKRYMTRLLTTRNDHIMKVAEGKHQSTKRAGFAPC